MFMQGEGQSPALPGVQAPVAGASALKLDALLGHRVRVSCLYWLIMTRLTPPHHLEKCCRLGSRCHLLLPRAWTPVCSAQVYWPADGDSDGDWWDGVVTDFNALTGQHWCASQSHLCCRCHGHAAGSTSDLHAH